MTGWLPEPAEDFRGPGVVPGDNAGIRGYRARMFKTVRCFLAAAGLAGCFALRPFAADAAPGRDASVSVMRERIEQFARDEGILQRLFKSEMSATRRERLGKFYDEASRELAGVNFDGLDQDGRVDYLLLRNRIRDNQRALALQASRAGDVAELLPFAPGALEVLEEQARMEPLDPERAAKAMNTLAADVRKVHDKFAAGDEKKTNAAAGSTNVVAKAPDKVRARRARIYLEELHGGLKEWRGFHAGYHPLFQWWAEEAYQRASKEIDEYSSFLKKNLMGVTNEDNEPLIGDPIGRARLIESLEGEMIAYTPEELIEIANREFAWCDAEKEKAVRDLGAKDWKDAIARASEHRAAPGDQPRLIRELADESTRFVEERGLVTVPVLCKEGWRMEMMTPERQKVSPYFTGGEVISVSYPTDTMAFEDKLMSMRGNNRPFSRATVQHELIPGHHLQTYMAARYRTHREMFSTPFLVEGWALYWEMLLWDLKFPQTPEDRVGMLFWRSHRCARIIFSLKYHLNQMTAEEAVDFLVDRVGHERRNATAEVRRSINGDYSPLYQAGYMLGGLQLRSLHRELVESGKMSDRVFHDAVLRENAIPIDMIRASLGGRPLTRDEKPAWRFYDLTSGK
jgi:uncharacterized protein (DUF885 family)